MTIEGYNELIKDFSDLAKVVGDTNAKKVLMKPALKLKNMIKSNAPKGPKGNLKKSIKAKKTKIINAIMPSVFVAIDRKIAPHAHLVEYGTSTRFPKKKKVLKFVIDGETIFAKNVKPMPPNPFFRRSIDSFQAGDIFEKEMNVGLKKLIDKAIR